jgi:hypothetical protein
MASMTGLWVWVWELHACEGGSVPAILAKANRAGVTGIILKCGEDGPTPEQVTPALVAACAAADVGLAVWWYCRPRAFDAQLAMLRVVQAMGMTCFVMDAEVEWDAPDQRAVARGFATRLRAALGPSAFLADAPWARPVKHRAPFPYAEFGSVMDARMPQFYWEIAAPEPQTTFLADADLEWAQTAPGAVVCPALSPVNYDGTKHAPVAELAAALDRYASRPALSIWSWQHLTPAEWTLLEARAAAQQGIPNPLAGEPVPGLVILGENDSA